MQTINFIVAFTNIVAIYPFLLDINCFSLFQRLLVITMTIASCLMHLSERKHKLNGIYPFNLFSWHFLQFDRVMAVLCTLYILFQLGFNHASINWFIAISGLILNGISELFDGYLFVATHSVWHFCAFSTLFASMK